jgi:NADH:ubiquinone oxidoreductase subunit K
MSELAPLELQHFLFAAAVLFALGVTCCVARGNAIGILIGIELMLNAANLNLVAFDRFSVNGLDGQVFAILVIILAACEAAIALAIMITMFMNFGAVDTDAADHLKG